MLDSNYIVKRNDIYVGNVCGINPERIVIHPQGMFTFRSIERAKQRLDNQPFMFNNNEQLDYDYGCGYPMDALFTRSMLFVLDENNHANDLLYNSPHYPIFNISENEDCLKSKISLLHHTYELGRVLKHFNYPEKLTFEDIVRIREFFFNCDFVFNNCELFGRYETAISDTGLEVFDSHGKHRTFNLVKEDSIFPPCYFHCFLKTKDYFQVEDFIGIRDATGRVVDSFIPHELEGPIRSLCKKT